MTLTHALFVLDLLAVMARVQSRTVRPGKWAIETRDGEIVATKEAA